MQYKTKLAVQFYSFKSFSTARFSTLIIWLKSSLYCFQSLRANWITKAILVWQLPCMQSIIFFCKTGWVVVSVVIYTGISLKIQNFYKVMKNCPFYLKNQKFRFTGKPILQHYIQSQKSFLIFKTTLKQLPILYVWKETGTSTTMKPVKLTYRERSS